MTTREKVLLWALIGVFLLSGGGLTYAYRNNIPFLKEKVEETDTSKVDSADQVDQAEEETTTETSADSAAATIEPIIDQGVTWQNMVAIADQKLFNLSYVSADNPIKYYKIATLPGNLDLILAEVPVDGIGGPSVVRFRKAADGKFYLLTKLSETEAIAENISTVLVGYGTKTDFDNQTTYAQISAPEMTKADNGALVIKAGSWIVSPSDRTSKFLKAATTAFGDIYLEKLVGSIKTVENRVLYLKHADGTYTSYTSKIPFYTDDYAPNVTFAGASAANTESYRYNVTAMCGSLISYARLATKPASGILTENGTTSTGDKIYKIADPQSQILKDIYSTYAEQGATVKYTYDQFAAANSVFIWKDAFGDYIIFVNDRYSPQGECGKPVIYLYPEKETKVSVKVGANITVSEPKYQGGWEAVVKPDGSLSIGATTYPYLFWEGIGHGLYPLVDSGFVVKSGEIEKTLRDHLARLGLNAKESADFMEFWLPKMPKTPYVRLTWFGTTQMNELAPLSVEPKPDTMIRVFLDFAGLDREISLRPQTLRAPERKGFTLVEWGGLLIR
jgi:hypothetical protein